MTAGFVSPGSVRGAGLQASLLPGEAGRAVTGSRTRKGAQWGLMVRVSLTPVGVSAAPRAPYSAPRDPQRRRKELSGGWRKGLVHTCAKTVRLPSGTATFTRPWCHATPAPASATPATAAAKGPGPRTARWPAANPRHSLAPQVASWTLRAAAIFAEALRAARTSLPGGPREILRLSPRPPSCSQKLLRAASELLAGTEGTPSTVGNGGTGKGPG